MHLPNLLFMSPSNTESCYRATSLLGSATRGRQSKAPHLDGPQCSRLIARVNGRHHQLRACTQDTISSCASTSQTCKIQQNASTRLLGTPTCCTLCHFTCWQHALWSFRWAHRKSIAEMRKDRDQRLGACGAHDKTLAETVFLLGSVGACEAHQQVGVRHSSHAECITPSVHEAALLGNCGQIREQRTLVTMGCC